MKTEDNKNQTGKAKSKWLRPSGSESSFYRPFLVALGVIAAMWNLHKNPAGRPQQSPSLPLVETEGIKDDNLKAKVEGGRAMPHTLPKPTYWPFFLAMGFTFIFWGLLTTWVILLAGLVILGIALWGWINLLRHE